MMNMYKGVISSCTYIFFKDLFKIGFHRAFCERGDTFDYKVVNRKHSNRVKIFSQPSHKLRPSVTKQVANNHNRNNNATVSTQMSWNYDPLSAGKYSITSQFPLVVGQLKRHRNSFIAG